MYINPTTDNWADDAKAAGGLLLGPRGCGGPHAHPRAIKNQDALLLRPFSLPWILEQANLLRIK